MQLRGEELFQPWNTPSLAQDHEVELMEEDCDRHSEGQAMSESDQEGFLMMRFPRILRNLILLMKISVKDFHNKNPICQDQTVI